MDELFKAIDAAYKEYEKEYGTDAKLEDGEKFFTIFNNAMLIISKEDGELKTEFLGDKPFQVDMTLEIFGEEGKNG